MQRGALRKGGGAAYPVNHRIYKVVKYGDPTVFSGVYALVTLAAAKAKAYTAKPTDSCAMYELKNATQAIELLRGCINMFGYAWC